MKKVTETDKQYLYDLILFCSLGDGYIQPYDGKKNSQLWITHSTNQIDYAKWKVALLENSGLDFGKPYFRKDRNDVRFRSQRHELCTVIRKRLYKNRTKTVTKRMLRRLTPLGLTIWFCDDGSYTKVKPRWRKNIYKVSDRNDYRVSQFKLYTNSFSVEENNKIVEIFQQKFNLSWKIYYYKNYPYLVLSGIGQLNRFKSIIHDHIPECMRYKIDHPTSFIASRD